jgi:Pvc16 N-terminal domain
MMAGFAAIADVTGTLVRLLRSHMLTGAEVTSAPPDVVLGVGGTRINIYLLHLLESAALRNMDIPGRHHPGSPGQPPLSLELRYLMTAHPEREDQLDAQTSAERVLGDAMSVMHHYGPLIDTETVRNAVAGPVGTPILEPSLIEEYERVKITLEPAGLDEITKIWSALSNVNFRLSTIYRVSVVQIVSDVAQTAPAPVETRALSFAIGNRPEILAAHLAVPPGQPRGETRLRIGDTLELRARAIGADRLYLRLGDLDPIRVVPDLSGVITIVLPDDQLPPDLDNPLPRPIAADNRLHAGSVQIVLEAEVEADQVAGGLGPGVSGTAPRRYRSNFAFIQLVPRITGIVPVAATLAGILRIDGTRIWRAGARTQVILGDAAIDVRRPAGGDPWADPTDTAVEVPLSAFQDVLPPPSVGGDLYPVAVQSNGARSRDAGFTFNLTP